ncbi:MAG TPA: acyl-CoA dehydrogenase family protein [Stellaceae bacterium]|nr:acyl-CoA dehydrogenase family protein [Stellaceae bacterium]
MDFTLSDEQRLIADSAERLIGDRYGFEERKRHMASPRGFSRELWATFAELGFLGVGLGEEHGGYGGAMETAILLEAFGRGLVVEPYLSTVVLGAGLVQQAGDDAQRAAILPRVIAGELLLAFAQGERQSRYTLSNVATTARPVGADGWRLDGHKAVVLGGDTADLLIVAARTAGAALDRDGISLFLVERTAPGVVVHGYPTVDGMRAADIAFTGVELPAHAVLGPVGGALPAIEHVVDRAIAGLCAEAVGAMQALNALTLDYLKTRKQFGQPLGSFQVLQHRMVDMTMAYEQAKSMAILAASHADEPDAAVRARIIAAAKVQIGKSGKFIGQQAVQQHGGIAITMEYAAGHYFKRLTTIDRSFGDVDHHLDRFAGLAKPAA